MNATFAKLNVGDADPIYVLRAPASFEASVDDVSEERTVLRALDGVTGARFVLGFAITKDDLAAIDGAVGAATEGDAVVWIAYPKASSKNYTCEFNRDTGWGGMGDAGFEPVRQVAIDADWSALRFRRAEYIKNWTRSFAYSAEGKRRLAERAGSE